MDVIDRANDLSDWLLAKQLAAQTGRSIQAYTKTDSRYDCAACDDPIPEGRRLALPGVTLCIACQSEQERLTR